MPSPPLLLLFLLLTGSVTATSQEDAVGMARHAIALAKGELLTFVGRKVRTPGDGLLDVALVDCTELYDDSEYRLLNVVEAFDVRAAVSAALTSHRTCIDGMVQRGLAVLGSAGNVSSLLRSALTATASMPSSETYGLKRNSTNSEELGMLASWDASLRKAEYVVAKDGSGDYRSINEALRALDRRGKGRGRIVVYVRAGVYDENVEIKRNMRNLMFVGDGIDRTVITGKRSVSGGSTTYRSATFGVSADGFWARDMTFENTAGAENNQAVALRVNSDRSVFFRCSVRGYQDTLFVHSLRQFYRECDIYGTIDFIFGNAAAILQRCTIIVRRPMPHQSNMITAQGRQEPGDNTGISIHDSHIVPAGDFEAVKGTVKTFLGRPWKRYSRTVFMKTDLDGIVHPRGWAQWRGRFALKTLYYAEYMNTGAGAATGGRVKWPGFHVLTNEGEAEPFTVGRLIQGEAWLPASGVPFSVGL